LEQILIGSPCGGSSPDAQNPVLCKQLETHGVCIRQRFNSLEDLCRRRRSLRRSFFWGSEFAFHLFFMPLPPL
jgi:hypothetical protein